MDEIEIVEYDPRWPALFREEAERLRAVLPADLVVNVEHFGSTAIPGMAAKPIIDILVTVRSLAAARGPFVALLEREGYLFWADNPKRDRLFFVKGLPPFGTRRTHHLHVSEPDGEIPCRLPFRAWLRTHPADARRYERLKRELARQHREDREAYTAAKTEFVDEILAKTRREVE